MTPVAADAATLPTPARAIPPLRAIPSLRAILPSGDPALAARPKQPQPQATPSSRLRRTARKTNGPPKIQKKTSSLSLSRPELKRLQKILAQSGIASRRHAEELITQGRVQVNGKVITELGSKADAHRDHIRVDGKLLHGSERQRYFMLEQAQGLRHHRQRPEGRPTIMEFFSKTRERLYPVGRLDYLSEGLLLVTNDGELANKSNARRFRC